MGWTMSIAFHTMKMADKHPGTHQTGRQPNFME